MTKTRVELCHFLGTSDKNGTITMKPIGTTRNRVKKPTLPGWKDVTTEIVIDRTLEKGLDGIEDYSHVIVVYWMDQEQECHLKHHPQGRADIPYIGIFACRCPQRPNRIAISTVPFMSRKGNVLTVQGLDILDKTPILDIKPYTPQYDDVRGTRVPSWVRKLTF